MKLLRFAHSLLLSVCLFALGGCGASPAPSKSEPAKPSTNAFEAALGKTNVKHTILRFDADHAFANPSNPHYDQKSATEAWAKVHAFLGRTLAVN